MSHSKKNLQQCDINDKIQIGKTLSISNENYFIVNR